MQKQGDRYGLSFTLPVLWPDKFPLIALLVPLLKLHRRKSSKVKDENFDNCLEGGRSLLGRI